MAAPATKNTLEKWIDRVIALLGVCLAVYFYFHPFQTRCLTYQVQPVRVPLVVAGEGSSLTAVYSGQPVTGNIYSTQVAVWNGGNEPIRPVQILEPLTIEVDPSVLLEARVLYTTHKVVNLQLDRQAFQAGKLSARWDILEKNDGGIIQLIYSGRSDTRIRVHAVIEGQREIEKNNGSEYRMLHPAGFLQRLLGSRFAGWIFLVLGIIGIYIGVIGIFRMKTNLHSGFFGRMISALIILVNMLVFSFGLYLLFLLKDANVPFAF